jgi:periplasmic protein TonB
MGRWIAILAASVALHGLLFAALFPLAEASPGNVSPHAETEMLIAPRAAPHVDRMPTTTSATPVARPHARRALTAQRAVPEIAFRAGPAEEPSWHAPAAPGPEASPAPAAAASPAPRAPDPAPDYGRIASACSRRIESVLRYPSLARRGRIEGTATVRFRIDETGVPRAPDLVASSGHRLLDEEALAAVVRAAPFPSCDRPVVVPVVFALK